MRYSGWNQRVVERDGLFAVHEVSYDEQWEPVGVTENPVAPIGNSLEELTAVVGHYQNALKLPVLHYSDFKADLEGTAA